ncbi:CARDB domain-containing protein [Nostoc sp. TCL26-01]|uniref:CARDB domain-containing protein n=1 Tax=Nostoc sp. TCL26-01 TaxID=2576904 RepID=UPI0015BA9ECE|nr:CARDB domain-containing protein [Nostoc sp. TCL26-01]QLE54695.1 peptidase S8 [Nostoc sp. TCL26-01]
MTLNREYNSNKKSDDINVTPTSTRNTDIFSDRLNYLHSIFPGLYPFKSSTASSSTAQTAYISGDKKDVEGNVAKDAAGNSIGSQAISATSTLPDLTAQNASIPTTAAVGSSIQINYQVKNLGNAAAGYSYTNFYLSSDLTIDSSDVSLGYDYVSGIAAGAYSQESSTLTIDSTVKAGSYYLIYHVDGDDYVSESNENNNAFGNAITITQPDLTAQNASIPTTAAVGSSIQINYQVKNLGNGSAGLTFTDFYLSSDLTIDSNDVYLGYDSVNSLAAGAYSQESSTLTINSSINTGNYYLIYYVDGDGLVNESNENNNAFGNAITITSAGKPDLLIQNATSPTSASVGSTLNISYQVKNQGVGSAVASTTKFYLSKDNLYSTDDVLLGSDSVNSIAAGAYSSETSALIVANSIAAGNYYLLFQADGNNNLAETSETNNLVAKAITINKADLIIQNATSPTSASVGSTLNISYQVKNQGVGSAIASTTKFYLSKDNLYSTDDVLLGSDSVNSIAAGAYSSETSALIIANSIASGNYYLLFQADGNNNLAETSETNNLVAKAITINKADLIIQNATSPASTSVGSTINISYQVKNQGVGSAVASTTKFYLSKDNLYSTDDVLLGSDSVNSIAANAYSSETSALIVANSIAAGNYYLLFQADGNSNVAETSETNNLVAKAITINGPKPDLIIQNISVPSLIDPGNSGVITFNYQLANIGTASAATSTTKFYLSKDASLSSDDTLLGYDQNYFYSGLSPNTYSAESYIAIINSNTFSGNYYLLFQADANGVISESNESNNIASKAITIAVPDLVIQNAVAPASANIGTNIQLSYQLKNQGNGTASYNTTYFYLSQDNSLSSDDINLGSSLISTIAPAGVSSQSASVYLSSTTALGNYFLLYRADGNNSLLESNENNNVVAKAITITAPDLVITSTTVPTSVAIGTTLTFTYEVKNQGNGNADASKTEFSLSRDTSIGNDDDVSIGYSTTATPILLPSGVFTQTISWTVDPTIAAGKYYLMFKADGSGDVAESNENNNSVYNTVPITVTPINGGGFNSTTGYGLINAAAAVAKALGQSTFADVPNLGGDDWAADMVKAPEVWAKGYTGQGVIVAVIDSGVDYTHPDLSANAWKNTKEIAGNGKDDDGNGYIDDVYGWNFVSNNNTPLDDNHHGTHVAGTIAAVKNSFGVTGIAYNAKIMAVKVLDSDGNGNSGAIANGIRYAVNNGARVINLSLGGSASTDEQSAIQYAASKGAIVVIAAGNDGGADPLYPARYANQWGLAVGAVFYNRTLTDFSNRPGTTPLAYVTAPGAYFTGDDDLGIGIYSTLPGGQYGFLRGTSMAAPQVSGVIALMLSAKNTLTDAQVRQIVTSTSGNAA